MGLFDKIKKVFTKSEEKTVEKYDKGLEKSRREFVSQLSNLSKRYKNINADYYTKDALGLVNCLEGLLEKRKWKRNY